MSFVDPSTPNLADFTTFVYNQGVTTAELPNNSQYLTWAFNHAVNITSTEATMPPPEYPLAVYNGGFHYLLKIAQDQAGQTFFQTARATYNLLSFVAGAVITSNDQGTGDTLSNPEFLQGMTVSALDFLKTPWGQNYLAFTQQYGPNIVGYS